MYPPRQHDWSTSVLVTSARVLRSLSPDTIAALSLVESGEATTQTDIAAAIGRDQSTVSTYFQSLEIEPSDISLVEKHGQRYESTDAGKEVLEATEAMLYDLGIDLTSTDWSSASEKGQIEDSLAPLHKSRSVSPFFVLNSLATRSAAETLQSDPLSVSFDKLIGDVKSRLQEIDKTTSKRQVRQIINRFVDSDEVRVTDEQLTLTEKGVHHSELQNTVAEIVEEQIPNSDGKIHDPTKHLEEIAMEMRRGRIATSWSLDNADPKLKDGSHFYHLVKRLDVLDTQNREWSSFRRITIENVSDEPTSSIVHKESGENKIEFAEMGVTASLEGSLGDQLEVRNLTEQEPAFEQKMEVFFPEPLPPGDQLTLRYQMKWPNEMAHYSSEERTQSISLSRYEHGVGKLEFGIVDTAEHVGVNSQKLVVGKDESWAWKTISTTPVSVAADDPDIPTAYNSGQSGYLYTIESPDCLGYRICYTPVE